MFYFFAQKGGLVSSQRIVESSIVGFFYRVPNGKHVVLKGFK